ncbi:MAG TPA: SusC/RagA family TonB-linked outer membrane protein [Chitinophagaceae bacterium]|nr:SusC/RagA family TonB-linked outer membrane protein [Chitinophagaceae bacterium]
MKKILLLFTMIMVSCSLAFAQQRTISGRVMGSDGNPVPFATVLVKGTQTGTTTDANGRFTITTPPNSILNISSVGYTTTNVVVGQHTNLAITIASNTHALNELVVTAFGVKRQARSVGYATASVSAKALNNGNPVDLQTGLTGRVAGLQINTTNNGVDPEYRITLRGERHVTGNNQALIVLDGMLVNSDILNTVNPEDIANVSILKGASAAALYGSDASNGVIIITTKHGTASGKPRITVSSTVQEQTLSYYPKFQTGFGGYGGEAQILYGSNGAYQWGVNPQTNFTNYVPYENESYGPPFNGKSYVMGGPLANGQTLKIPYAAASKAPLVAFAQTGMTYQNSISYSGGDAKNNYFLSAQDVNLSGVVPKDISRRDNLRFSDTHTYGIFSAQFDVNYSRVHSNTAGPDPISGNPVVWNLLNEPVNFPITQFKNWQTNPYADPLQGWPNAYYTNPYWQIDVSRQDQKIDELTGALNLTLAPTSWLKFSYRLSANVRNYEGSNTTAGFTETNSYYDTPAGYGPWFAFSSIASTSHKFGSLNVYNQYHRRLEQDFIINFDKKFGDFSVSAFVGNTIWDRYQNGQNASSSNEFIPNFFQINYITGVPSVGQYISDNRLIGLFGDITLGYKNFLFVHGSLRNDWTSLLAAGHNSFLYPDIDASLVFSDMIPALKNSSFLTYGKLRAAYSITGEVSTNPYGVQNVFDVPGNFPYGQLPGLQVDGFLRNPGLVPEKSFDREVGADLGFWRDRLNVTLDYYFTSTFNQTFPVQLSSTSGFNQALVNGGDMNSSGVEITANFTPLIRTNSGFIWNIGANLAYNNSNVVALYGGVKQFQIPDNNGTGTTSYAVVGQPYPVIKAADYARDPANGKILVGTNGMPEENPNLVVAGRSTPQYILGMTTSISFKHFTLALSGDYRGGYNIAEAIGGSLDFTGVGIRSTSAGRQNFIWPNSEVDLGNGKYVPNTSVATQDGNLGLWVDNQNFAYSSGLSLYTAHTNYVISAAAIKLRTASLTYDFSWLLSKTRFITGGSLSLVGYNLLMWVPSQNVYGDPEFNYDNSNATGYTDQNQFPATRSFGANITLNF